MRFTTTESFYLVEQMVFVCVVIFVLQDFFKLFDETESMFFESFLEILRNDKFSFDFHARILGRKFFLEEKCLINYILKVHPNLETHTSKFFHDNNFKFFVAAV